MEESLRTRSPRSAARNCERKSGEVSTSSGHMTASGRRRCVLYLLAMHKQSINARVNKTHVKYDVQRALVIGQKAPGGGKPRARKRGKQHEDGQRHLGRLVAQRHLGGAASDDDLPVVGGRGAGAAAILSSIGCHAIAAGGCCSIRALHQRCGLLHLHSVGVCFSHSEWDRLCRTCCCMCRSSASHGSRDALHTVVWGARWVQRALGGVVLDADCGNEPNATLIMLPLTCTSREFSLRNGVHTAMQGQSKSQLFTRHQAAQKPAKNSQFDIAHCMDAQQQQGVEAAIGRAVLVTISGNDHTKTKAKAAPFHLFRNGVVTLSSTGALGHYAATCTTNTNTQGASSTSTIALSSSPAPQRCCHSSAPNTASIPRTPPTPTSLQAARTHHTQTHRRTTPLQPQRHRAQHHPPVHAPRHCHAPSLRRRRRRPPRLWRPRRHLSLAHRLAPHPRPHPRMRARRALLPAIPASRRMPVARGPVSRKLGGSGRGPVWLPVAPPLCVLRDHGLPEQRAAQPTRPRDA